MKDQRTEGPQEWFKNKKTETPRDKTVPFGIKVFERYSRDERVLDSVILESYIQGVLTRNVMNVMESLGVYNQEPPWQDASYFLRFSVDLLPHLAVKVLGVLQRLIVIWSSLKHIDLPFDGLLHNLFL